MTHIGTSGFSFPDWKGRFYPADIKPSLMFDYYVKMFDCIEINATYYRIPDRSTFEGLNARSPEAYPFIVKTHKQVTHVANATARDTEHSMRELFRSVEPIRTAQKLKGLLAQFPYAFRNTQQSREHLLRVKELSKEIPLFVEFRHAGWMNPAVETFLRNNAIGYVNVDEPNLPGLLPAQQLATTDTGYVRFHGRNAKAWWGSGDAESGSTERYDYNYSDAELNEWIARIESLQSTVKGIYLFFNNCVRGQAAGNAIAMRRKLGLPERGQREEMLF